MLGASSGSSPDGIAALELFSELRAGLHTEETTKLLQAWRGGQAAPGRAEVWVCAHGARGALAAGSELGLHLLRRGLRPAPARALVLHSLPTPPASRRTVSVSPR